jgi:hypothetical protein
MQHGTTSATSNVNEMKNIRHEIALWAQAIAFIAIWLTLVYGSGETILNWQAISKIPDVVLIYGACYLLFTKWVWRQRVFQGWLVPFPDLQGTWTGELRTTWVDPETGRSPGPIAAKLVVRQTFERISCAIHTAESSSHSTAASLQQSEDDGVKKLAYVYTNTPRVGVRHLSVVHDGATVLDVRTSPSMQLVGEYWTNRKSTGELTFTFRDRQLDDAF